MSVPAHSHHSLAVVERARRYVAAMPAAISGEKGHDATFSAACALVHGFLLPEQTAYALLAAEFNPRCQPRWSFAELEHKVRSAAGVKCVKPPGYLLGDAFGGPRFSAPPCTSKWPQVDDETRRNIVGDGPDAAGLRDHSVLKFEPTTATNVAEILALLYSTVSCPDPLLCIGKSSQQFATRRLGTWVISDKLQTCSLIVPSPMCSRTGRTKDGHESEHTLDNTGARRFLVVEFDDGTTDEHAALLWHLRGFAPLTLVVHSGGKSLHGWFYSEGQTEADLRRFMNYAVSLGADRATWTRCQFVRLPNGQRENGAPQPVLYFDPASISTTEDSHV